MEIPNRNVIILGAGASYTAGIPLLSQFVEKMWEIADKKKAGGVPLEEKDLTIFEEAIQIRKDIDNYHGRASFDDLNLEDILSILSFEDQFIADKSQKKVDSIVRAISRTIELMCKVKPNINLSTVQKEKSDIHVGFWSNLIDIFSDTSILPSIITFNYDLVLERSLFHLFIQSEYKDFKIDNFTLNLFFKNLENVSYGIIPTTYHKRDSNDSFYTTSGSKVKYINQGQKLGLLVEILKLHGSLNFNKNVQDIPNDLTPLNAVENPIIIPPVANKQLTKDLRDIWSTALNRLRCARNIIFIGYSFPETDVYFRYFIKSAIGPNADLSKVFVFNPGLDDGMKNRYLSCFSDQYRKRVEFNVLPGFYKDSETVGTFKYFNQIIQSSNEMLFYK